MKKLCLSGLLLCASLALASPANFDYARPTIRTVVSQGNPVEKVDLVFVSDGYLARQSSTFERDVKDAANELFQYSFFREYRSYFNVHSAFVASFPNQFAFGSMIRNPADGMVTITKKAEVEAVASKAPGCDIVIVLSTLPGRASGGHIVCLPSRSYAPLAHELGHRLGKLGDEYDSSSSLVDRENHHFNEVPNGGDLPYPNLTLPKYFDNSNRASLKKTIKWKHFLELPGSDPLLGAFQGGYYRAVDVYRPSYSCIMRSSQAPFCPVCHEAMVIETFKICGIPFDDAAYHRRHPLSQWKGWK